MIKNLSLFFVVCACIFFLKPNQCFGFQSLSPLRSHGASTTNHRDINSVSRIGIKFSNDVLSSYNSRLLCKLENKDDEIKEPSAFDQVASKGLAGVLAIAAAEAIFWALGVPLASLWVKYTTGEWIDLMTTDGQLQAAGFSFGYGGFATLILQYRVTLFAIPLVPVMEKLVVEPGKKFFGEKFGEKKSEVL